MRRRKKGEGRRFQTEFAARSTRRYCQVLKTARSPTRPNQRIVDSLQNSQDVPCASAHPPKTAQSSIDADCKQIAGCSTHLHAAARSRSRKIQKVVDSNQNSFDAPRAGAPIPKTRRRSSIPNRIRRTIHAPTLPPAQNNEMIVDSKQNSSCKQNCQDAPRASWRRGQPPKTARASSIPDRILNTLHEPALPLTRFGEASGRFSLGSRKCFSW